MFTITPGRSWSVVRRLLVGIGVMALIAGAAVPVLAIGGAWTATGSMTTAHGHHRAALLPDGRVLVAAGYGPPGASIGTSSDLYNPATGTFSAGGQLNFGRIDFAAASLADGRVLVTGGSDDFGYLWSAELFNPATGTWSNTGNMGQARSNHTATLLNTGKVLVAGGVGPFCAGCNSGMTAELFDPATGTWSPTGSMSIFRSQHTATLLSDGKVLVAGGNGATAEVYDPATGTFSPSGSMTTTRANHTATLLPDGRVLVSGGTVNFQALASAEIFNPATGTWSPTGSMTTTRVQHSRAAHGRHGADCRWRSHLRLNDLGGVQPTGTWTATGALPAIQESPFSATRLTDGRVLVAGGMTTDANNNVIPTASAALFTPGATASASLGSLSLSPTSVTAGSGSQGTVTLTGAAPAGGVGISLSSSNPAMASVPASVTVPAGASSATFTVATAQVSATTTTVTISASLGGATRSAGLTVVPADSVAITLAEYDAAKQVLSVQATSTSTTVTLTVSVTSTGQVIGTLTNAGGGKYQGQLGWPVTHRTSR